jgi:hypothetical protein
LKINRRPKTHPGRVCPRFGFDFHFFFGRSLG